MVLWIASFVAVFFGVVAIWLRLLLPLLVGAPFLLLLYWASWRSERRSLQPVGVLTLTNRRVWWRLAQWEEEVWMVDIVSVRLLEGGESPDKIVFELTNGELVELDVYANQFYELIEAHLNKWTIAL